MHQNTASCWLWHLHVALQGHQGKEDRVCPWAPRDGFAILSQPPRLWPNAQPGSARDLLQDLRQIKKWAPNRGGVLGRKTCHTLTPCAQCRPDKQTWEFWENLPGASALKCYLGPEEVLASPALAPSSIPTLRMVPPALPGLIPEYRVEVSPEYHWMWPVVPQQNLPQQQNH